MTPSPTETAAMSHESRVSDQFGPRAAQYLASAVHAGGADLDQAEALAADLRPAQALDLGCGGGHLAFRLAPHAGAVVALDLTPRMVATVAEAAAARGLSNLRAVVGRVERLDFADAGFDLVATRYSAHHWHRFDTGLAEAFRVLKPGGTALFMDCVAPGAPMLDTFLQTIESLRDPSHVRNYTCGAWVSAVERAGFLPVSMTCRRLELEFSSWVGRMATPAVQVEAIRALQALALAPVAEHFALRPDGTFTLDTMTLVCRRAG